MTTPGRLVVPRRLGIMPDGNRRWAAKSSLTVVEGHRQGAAHLQRFWSWCEDLGIESVTAWLATERNILQRPQDELSGLYEVIGELAREVARQRRYRLAVIGNLHMVPPRLQAALADAVGASASVDGMEVVLGVACGGRMQIVRAVEGCLAQRPGEAVTEQAVAAWLARHHHGELDLIIRTSGESRLSDMGLWEAAWAELHFSGPLWEEFTRSDLDNALKEFASRRRRFGH